MELFREEWEGTRGSKGPPKANHCTELVQEESVYYKQLQSLVMHDQLRKEMAARRVFPGFLEGMIKFLPTFKYDKGTTEFDTSAKARCPAW